MCVTRSFHLALCNNAPALAFFTLTLFFRLVPSNSLSKDLPHIRTRTIYPSHSVALSFFLSCIHSLSLCFSLVCSRSLLSIPWCFPSCLSQSGPLSICHRSLEMEMCAWNVCVRKCSMWSKHTHVLVSLSCYASPRRSIAACTWWFSMNECCANIVFHFHFDFIPTSQPTSQMNVMYVLLCHRERVHTFFPCQSHSHSHCHSK